MVHDIQKRGLLEDAGIKSTTGNSRILIVEDEVDLAEILQFNLRYDGYFVETALSAEEALEMDLSSYDLFVLDVMMGKISGFQLADKIRNNLGIDTPIIFLTAKGDENDMLTGYSLGADDYIRKPFSVVEVKARIRAILKRVSVKSVIKDPVTIGSFTLNRDTQEVMNQGVRIDLTRKEYDILEMLVLNTGRFVPRNEILESIWPDTFVSERTIDVHITRLRKRLGDFGERIRSKTGYGYYIEL